MELNTTTHFYSSEDNISCLINTSRKCYNISKEQMINYIVGMPSGIGLNFIGLLSKNPNSTINIKRF